MNKDKNIFAIFTFRYSAEKASSYFILYLFDESGLITSDELRNISKEFDYKEEYLGPFESLDYLNNFLKKLAYYKNAEFIYSFSTLDFNRILEEITVVNEFLPALIRQGHPMKAENPEKKKSFLGIFE